MSPDTERNSQLANVDQLLEAFFRYKNKVLDQQQKTETNCKLNPTKSHILGMILREKNVWRLMWPDNLVCLPAQPPLY